jgi:Homeodomain-like domain
MGSRHPNPRLVKIHRNYSVEDIARLFGIHKNTVRNWLKQGLRPSTIDGRYWSSARSCRVSCTSFGRRQSSRVGQAGSIASHAARRRSRPGRWRNAPPPAPWRATCAASAPTATGLSTGESISQRSMRFAANWRSRSHSLAHALGESAVPSVNCDSGQKAQAHENA